MLCGAIILSFINLIDPFAILVVSKMSGTESMLRIERAAGIFGNM